MRMAAREYVEVTDELSQAFRSLKSAVGPEEQAREAEWVRRVARQLLNAKLSRPKQLKDSDRCRAEGLLDATAVWLTDNGL